MIFQGEVYVFPGGRIARVLDVDFPSKGMISIQYIDEDAPRYVEKNYLKSAKFQAFPDAEYQFELARSIHLRLNRLGRV